MTAPDPQNPPPDQRLDETVDLELREREDVSVNGPAPERSTGEEAFTVPADYTPRKRPSVLELDMGDGVILYDDDASLVHHLNPSAALIWQICDGSGSVEDLARDIAEEYGLDVIGMREQVAGVVAEFDALGLIENVAGGTTDA